MGGVESGICMMRATPANEVAWRYWLVVFGCALVQMPLGAMYVYNTVGPYIIDYMNNSTFYDREIDDPSTTIQVTLESHKTIPLSSSRWLTITQALGLGLAMPLAGFLHHRIGLRLTVFVSSLFLGGGVALTNLTIRNRSFYGVILTYGLMPGIGIGLGYAAPLVRVLTWRTATKSLAMGFVLSTFGVGMYAANEFRAWYLSYDPFPVMDPNDRSIGRKLDNLPKMFLFVGLGYAVAMWIGALLMYQPTRPSQALHGTRPMSLSNEGTPLIVRYLISRDIFIKID
eukprot:c15156_g1_i2.p1 GENE.c15156_g1_i2~~c15156_g1_i2.p1  ORF type:complete len:285 (-),score=41.00 c15156_g1_i2:552-1406(-)